MFVSGADRNSTCDPLITANRPHRFISTQDVHQLADLEIPSPVVAAVTRQRTMQAADAATAGRSWQNSHDLVFTTEVGTL